MSFRPQKITLSPREEQIITLACEGETAREISNHLGIAKRTVEHYTSTLIKKLGARNLANACAIFERNKHVLDPSSEEPGGS